MSDNIDNLAQSFFVVLIFCSVLNDSYSIMNNFFNNDHVQKKMKYYNDVYTAVKHIFVNNYENDSDGSIIIDEFRKENIQDSIKEDIREDKESIEKNNKIDRAVFINKIKKEQKEIKKNIKEERTRKIKS